MKKQIALFLGFILLATNASAFDTIFARSKKFIYQATTITRRNSTLEQQLIGFGNLTFFKDFAGSQDSINADYSVGSPTGTFTASRGASNPATYVDASGVVQTTTTSNTARFCGGFYDSTGFVSRPGIMVEGAATNLVPKSNTYNDATWTASNVTITDSSGITSPDGTAASTLTSSAGNGTVLLATAVTAATYSVWIQRKTGTGNIDISADGGATWVTQTLVAGAWARFSVSAASASQKCGIRLVTSGDAIYVFGSQFQTGTFASSYIPTTSVALTRNAETISYPVTSNRTGATESIFFNFTPFKTFANDSTFAHILDDSTASRQIIKLSAGTKVSFYPSGQLSPTSTVITTTSPAALTKYVLGAIAYGTGAGTNTEIYINGVSEGTNTTDYASPAMGTNFYIGVNNGNILPCNGIYTSATFYSDAKSAADTLAISNILT